MFHRSRSIVYCKGVEDHPRIVVALAEELKYLIIFEAHDTALSGHLGREKIYSSVIQTYQWPKLYKWVIHYVRTCETCPRVKTASHSADPLASLPIPCGCWASICMELVFGLPKDSDGNTGIEICVGLLSKMDHLAAVPNTIDDEGTVTLLIDRVFRQHSLHGEIVSDRDPRFTEGFGSMSLRCQAPGWTCPRRIVRRPMVEPDE